MNSTRGPRRPRTAILSALAALTRARARSFAAGALLPRVLVSGVLAPAVLVLWALVLGVLVPEPGRAAEDPVPRPPQLERDVQFWIRVYTQIDTNAGFLHDQYNLGVVYDTLHFAPNTPPGERERQVDEARNRYGAALRRIAAAGDGPQL